MAKTKKAKPIRLTNKTAISLRKTAQRVRSAWLIAMGVFTMLATVLAVYLGFSWLPAVPLTLLSAGVVIALMMLISRSQYLILISQAICTEASSRQMEEYTTEQTRRRKAIEQLAAMRADVREAQENGTTMKIQRGEESLLFDLLTGREPSEEEIQRQRLNEEDEEMYAASYQEEASADEDTDDDLLPPIKRKRSGTLEAKKEILTSVTQGTRVVKNVSMNEQKETAQDSPRRRRRSAPAQNAPLQLIRGDQAQ